MRSLGIIFASYLFASHSFGNVETRWGHTLERKIPAVISIKYTEVFGRWFGFSEPKLLKQENDLVGCLQLWRFKLPITIGKRNHVRFVAADGTVYFEDGQLTGSLADDIRKILFWTESLQIPDQGPALLEEIRFTARDERTPFDVSMPSFNQRIYVNYVSLDSEVIGLWRLKNTDQFMEMTFSQAKPYGVPACAPTIAERKFDWYPRSLPMRVGEKR